MIKLALAAIALIAANIFLEQRLFHSGKQNFPIDPNFDPKDFILKKKY